jgi:hypothetical protein
VISPNNVPSKPVSLMVNNSMTALGIRALTPTLSWQFQDLDSWGSQSAYRVLINSGNVWDSGEVSSSFSAIQVPANILVTNNNYLWRVKTKDDRGAWSVYSDAFVLDIASGNTAPSAPASLLTNGRSQPELSYYTVPVFSWQFNDINGSDSQSAYRVRLSSANVIWDSVVVNTSANSVTLPMILTVNGTYYWQVQVRDDSTWLPSFSWSALSPTASFTLAAPLYPISLNVNDVPTAQALLDLAPTLSWTFNSLATGNAQTAYKVVLAVSSGNLWDSGEVVSSLEYLLIPQNILTTNGSYFWSVKTRNELGVWSNYCPTNNFSIAPANFAPLQPGSLLTNSNNGPYLLTGSVPTFSWQFTDPDNADVQSAFELMVSADNFIWDSGIQLSTANTFTLPFALTSNAVYIWKVKVRDDSNWVPSLNWSIYSASANFRVAVPAVPAGLQVNGESAPQLLSELNPTLSWNYSDPGTGNVQSAFRVLLATNTANLLADYGNVWDSGTVSASASSLRLPVTLAKNMTYFWKVRTKDNAPWLGDDIWSGFSSVQAFSTVKVEAEVVLPPTTANVTVNITIPEGATIYDISQLISDVVASVNVIQSSSEAPSGFEHIVGIELQLGGQQHVTFNTPVEIFIDLPPNITGNILVAFWSGTDWSTEGIVITSRNTRRIGFTTTHFTFFSVMSQADNTGPTINHAPISSGVAGTAVTVNAVIEDTTGLAYAVCYYKTTGTGTWTTATMNLLAGSTRDLSVVIPGGAVSAAGIDYYLQAFDTVLTANSSFAPTSAPAVPYLIRVQTITNTANLTLTKVFNFPNPFDSAGTKFTYLLSRDAETSIKIFNISGRRVSSLGYSSGVEGGKAGVNRVFWNGLADDGAELANDVYFYIVEARSGSEAKSAKGKLGIMR